MVKFEEVTVILCVVVGVTWQQVVGNDILCLRERAENRQRNRPDDNFALGIIILL